ncbi:hypothetical protein GH714_036572 [Hevea brasiliensis]|uniref:Uncharacterized protein n=1 Tax=Hevea brasiliensis TaxID=3981 RepID=A0A6A6LPR6_HEVBR|nr:hypothetical protein GH714_036572 [Hevea brasiliensis]
MGFFSQNKKIFVILIVFLSFFLVAGMRPLRDHQWLNMQDGPLLQSLQKSSGSNPCSNIPGQGTGVCSRKVAGNSARSPPAVPKLVMADMRPLGDQQWQNMQDGLLFQSLQKGQGKSSGSNPCSNIPGQGTGVCTRKVAGNSVRSPSAVPKLVMADMRPLGDQQWQNTQDGLLLQSLQGQSSKSNQCGNIPGQGTGVCSRKVAKNIVRSPPAFPKLVMADMRPLGDQQRNMHDGLLLQSLQGQSSQSNPCGNIPGQGTGVCTRKIAGNVVRAPPAVPNLVMDVSGASSIASETNKQHPTS